jgi:predicted TPR repeat methyltransferase
LADYDKVIQLQPNWYAPYLQRAIIDAYQSHFDLAIADASKVITLRPDDGMGYALRATGHWQRDCTARRSPMPHARWLLAEKANTYSS